MMVCLESSQQSREKKKKGGGSRQPREREKREDALARTWGKRRDQGNGQRGGISNREDGRRRKCGQNGSPARGKKKGRE